MANFSQFQLPEAPSDTNSNVGGFVTDEGGLKGNNMEVASGGVNSAKIVVGQGANSGGVNSAGQGSDIVFWAGATHSNRATAPFRVNAQGDLNATSATLSGVLVATQGSFGGDGSDGALSVTSGTTTLDLLSAEVAVFNYTSISITGTGAIAFSNPASSGTIIYLKSQGAVTITSSATRAIDLRNTGAAGGAGGTTEGADGATGTGGLLILDTDIHGGRGGNAAGTGGIGGLILNASGIPFYTTTSVKIYRKALFVACGSGGGGGEAGNGSPSSGNGVGGDGGRGGGALIIECNGAFNFTTTTIDASGTAGTAAPATSGVGVCRSGGGGGGGSAGMVIVLYKTLTANSGTISTLGGVGGAGGDASDSGGGGNPAGSGGGGGAGAGSFGGAGGDGGAGAGNVVGVAGSAGAGIGAGGGGGGGAGNASGAADTNAGGAGGAAGATNGGVVVENILFG